MYENMTIKDALAEYQDLGYDPIPLLKGEKVPALPNWQTMPVEEQWAGIGKADEYNAGLRMGGGIDLVVWDADEPKAAVTFRDVLDMLGIDRAAQLEVRTASGNTQFYFRLPFGERPAGNYCLFKPSVGKGEFRYGTGAQVVAAPSVVGGTQYKIVSGDLRTPPVVALEHFIKHLRLKESGVFVDPAEAVVGWQVDNPIPRRAMALLMGEGVDRFQSRSEAEQAILVLLANALFTFRRVRGLFIKYPAAGKYQELRKKSQAAADKYLQRSWKRAWSFASTPSPEWAAAQAAVERVYWQVVSKPWPGRTGATDQQVFLAWLGKARMAGLLAGVNASSRELAESAGVSHVTATKAIKRLVQQGKLVKTGVQEGTDAPGYTLGANMLTNVSHTQSTMSALDSVEPARNGDGGLFQISQNSQFTHSSLLSFNANTPRACEDVLTYDAVSVNSCNPTLVVPVKQGHDAFRWKGLGKAAEQVYTTLLNGGVMSAAELARRTGRGIRTVQKALSRMSQLGEDNLVEQVECGWRALAGNLDRIAVTLETAGAGMVQREKFSRQRKDWRNNVHERRRLELEKQQKGVADGARMGRSI